MGSDYANFSIHGDHPTSTDLPLRIGEVQVAMSRLYSCLRLMATTGCSDRDQSGRGLAANICNPILFVQNRRTLVAVSQLSPYDLVDVCSAFCEP